jgi:hypothetical protein
MAVSLPELLSAHKDAVANGLNVQELADKLEMKVTSLNQRLNGIRTSLREQGATDAEVAIALPPLTRRKGERPKSNAPIISDLLAFVRATAEAEAPASEVEEPTESELVLVG